MRTIEEMLGEDAAKDFAFPADVRDRALKALGILGRAGAEIRDAIRTVASLWISFPANRLLSDEALAEQPLLHARLMGRKKGMEALAEELTDPASMALTREWLSGATKETTEDDR